jgi:adenylosuccinate synthase
MYVGRIEQWVRRPVGVISIGQERDQTIVHHTQIPELP